MELKRVNVLIDEDAHDILAAFQKERDYRTRDKAVAELFREFKSNREELKKLRESEAKS